MPGPLSLFYLLAATLLLALTGARGAECKIGLHTLTVPDGFEVELAAAPPLVERPVTMAFDETGALYVADSSGSNESPANQLKNPSHRILRLVDRDGDGKFDTSTVYADKIMFPSGTMWLDGSLYVAAPPQIWKLTDTDGDGVADRREVWFDGKTLTGCANDLHGPYAGPDGFIYWCKGAFAEQRHTLGDGKEFVSKAAHIFRARPDGSGLEAVLTGGMDNPVDIVFSPSGERFLSGTFFVHPGGGQRDGILHAVYGGVWGKDHSVLDGHPRTGELLPIMTHLGPAAACGLELMRSDAWGSEWKGNLFACNFNLRKITRHTLAPDGATFHSEDSDFLVSDQTDFHPTDIIEDADGSLLVADTGGWYKLCCPTSQLMKPDVLGAVYRIRKIGAARVGDPRGLQLDWTHADAHTLAQRLADPRPAVTSRAAAALAKLGESAIAPCAALDAATSTPQAQINTIWALTRIPGDAARAAVRAFLKEGDSEVRHAAALSAALWRDSPARGSLLTLLESPDAQLQRAAAEALGRLREAAATESLLAAAGRPAKAGANDRMLEHSLTFALFESATPASLQSALRSASTGAQRAALTALDMRASMSGEAIVPFLGSLDGALRERAAWVAARHPEWAATLAAWLRENLARKDQSGAAARTILARFADREPVQRLIADAADGGLGNEAAGSSTTEPNAAPLLAAFAAMAASHLKDLPAEWSAPLIRGITSSDATRQTLAIEAAHAFAASKSLPSAIPSALRQIAADSHTAPVQRLAALSALPGTVGSLEESTFSFLREQLGADSLQRGLAASILARAKLNPAQLNTIAEQLATADPMTTSRLLPAFEAGGDAATGERLLGAFQKSTSLSAVPADAVRRAIAKFPDSIQKQVEALLAARAPDEGQKKARLDQLAAHLPEGDTRRGHQLFRSGKAMCTLCHAMAYVGGNLGPDLTKIGGTRNGHDLLEAIVFPSASFVRSYEPALVKTRSGPEYLGIVKADGPAELILATGPGAETRLPRSEIADIQPGNTSLMPLGFDGILTPQELADLVAFLQAAK